MNDTLREKLKHLPEKPGCYLYRDRAGKIIYVGKAVNLRRRVQSYFRASTLRKAPPKLRSLVHHVEDLEIRVVRTEAEALLTESHLIKTYRPRFNILLRDDKRYLALKADPTRPFPRLTTCRIMRDDGARYFGPFPSSTEVRTALDFTEKRFGLRKCSSLTPCEEDHKHCLADVIRFCSAPCLGRISETAYRERFEDACAFLRGERPDILEEVRVAMIEAAEKEAFEKAARLRDTWLALKSFTREQAKVRNFPTIPKPDAGEGLSELASLLGLTAPPRCIECFDISHLMGTYTVASMVTAIDGVPDRRRYRRFRIRTVTNDDPHAMAEVIRRRYTRLQAENAPLPDLILCDGANLQVRATRDILRELGLYEQIPVAGLNEHFEEIVLDDDRPNLILPRDSKALQILMRLRDEAHRFAITFNRALRLHAMKTSILDELPGIGPHRKQQLLTTFGSVRRLAAADETAIAQIPGITPEMARAIKDALTARILNPE
ncbi:MAG: excinuclease ABC subunit UvrC [Kiritimatiellae bacterium]|nr:excinuclease ABC subunit UvrC [Kiritimatiellia bacterium]